MRCRWHWAAGSFVLGLGVASGMFAVLHYLQFAQKTVNQVILPTPLSLAEPNPLVIESRFSCQTNAVTAANRAWMEACYVTGRLSLQCQQLFYDDGNYLKPSSTSTQYEYDQKMCACALPSTLAEDLNAEAEDSWNSCSDYPNAAQLLQ